MVVGFLAFVPGGPAGGDTFSNTATINVPSTSTSGPASPYPSSIGVSDLSGTVTDVNVTLDDLTHTFPPDIDILLVGPAGQNAIIMSDASGGADVSDIDLTLDDEASGPLPFFEELTPGSY
ncbi:MAG: hypothetical protein ACRDH5_17855, partial [bacterium]